MFIREAQISRAQRIEIYQSNLSAVRQAILIPGEGPERA
jgi:hypothetical protein